AQPPAVAPPPPLAAPTPPSTSEAMPSGVARSPAGMPESAVDFTDRQRRILDWIREKGALTSREYCERMGVSQRTALRDLADLVRTGVLVRTGSRKAAIYRTKPGEKASAAS